MYYKEIEGEEKLIGAVFADISSNDGQGSDLPWIWHVNEDGDIEITGLDFTNYVTPQLEGFTINLGIEILVIPSRINGRCSKEIWT